MKNKRQESDVSLAEQAYEKIKADIVTCALMPGEQIAQPQLAERYGFGTTPIREALQRLAQEGYVQPMPRYGYMVSPVTLSDVREIFELRSIIDQAAVKLVVVRATQEQLKTIMDIANYTFIHRDELEYSEFLTRGEEFHNTIADFSGNERLAAVSHKLDAELTRIFYIGLNQRDYTNQMLEEHLALAQALSERDAAGCVSLVESHNEGALSLVLEALMRESPLEPGTVDSQPGLINVS
jgi:DNA-binding GntR family transcriptional regulator